MLSAARVLLSETRVWFLVGFTIMRPAFGKKKTSATANIGTRADDVCAPTSPAVAGDWAGSAPPVSPEVRALLQRIKTKLRQF
jgi:hypothetical protein